MSAITGGLHGAVRLRVGPPNGEIICTPNDAQAVIEFWQRRQDAVRAHGSLGQRPPAPETIIVPSWPAASEMASLAVLD